MWSTASPRTSTRPTMPSQEPSPRAPAPATRSRPRTSRSAPSRPAPRKCSCSLCIVFRSLKPQASSLKEAAVQVAPQPNPRLQGAQRRRVRRVVRPEQRHSPRRLPVPSSRRGPHPPRPAARRLWCWRLLRRTVRCRLRPARDAQPVAERRPDQDLGPHLPLQHCRHPSRPASARSRRVHPFFQMGK